MTNRERELERALRLIWAEARKSKPDPDKIFGIAEKALIGIDEPGTEGPAGDDKESRDD